MSSLDANKDGLVDVSDMNLLCSGVIGSTIPVPEPSSRTLALVGIYAVIHMSRRAKLPQDLLHWRIRSRNANVHRQYNLEWF